MKAQKLGSRLLSYLERNASRIRYIDRCPPDDEESTGLDIRFADAWSAEKFIETSCCNKNYGDYFNAELRDGDTVYISGRNALGKEALRLIVYSHDKRVECIGSVS